MDYSYPPPHIIPGILLVPFTLAAASPIGTVATATVQVQAETDFLVRDVVGVMRLTTSGRICSTDDDTGGNEIGGQTDFPATVMIRELGTTYAWMSQAVDGASLWISGRPWQLSVPRLISGGSVVEVTIATLKVPATAWTAQVLFRGHRDFSRPSLRQRV